MNAMVSDDEAAKRHPGERLIDFYRRFQNPELTGLEAPLLEAFERFVNLADWVPSNPYLGGYDRPLELGLIFAFLQEAGAADLLAEARFDFLKKGYVEAPLRAELRAGALLRRLGCSAVFLPRAKQRTPDIVIPHGDQTIDVEVVAGQRKASNRALQARLGDLTHAINLRSDADILVFLNRELSTETFADIVAASSALGVGGVREKEGLWKIVALLPAGREIDEHATATRLDAEPIWWVRPTMLSLRCNLGEAPRRVEAGATFPIEDYLNPVLRKANRPQRSGKANPYLIALDVSHIPNAQQAVVEHVKLAMTTWDQVSGVLLFYDFLPAMSERAWRVRLLRNAAASIPLPPDFLPELGEILQGVVVDKLPA